MKRALKAVAALLFVLLVALAVLLRLRYGGGAEFPDRSGPPEFSADVLEVVAELPSPPGNIAVSGTGRVFFSFHPEARPEIKIAEWRDGHAVAWPNEAFQDDVGEERYFRSVLSLRIDRQDRLWTLDAGHHGMEAGRLLAFDLETGQVVHEFVFPDEIAGPGSHLNDFQVSPDGRWVYIAEASFFGQTPALVVYDVQRKRARRAIENHISVVAEKYIPVVQGRRMQPFGLVAIRPGVDSIALDARGEWLYFAPVTNNHMYRVRAADLRDATLSREELLARVETFAEKTMSDGLSMDREGNIYISDPEHSAILALTPERQLRTLVKDERLRWPDGFSFGPEGWLYVTCSSLQQVIGRPPWSVQRNAPYQIYRFKPGPEGVPGH